MVVVPKLVADLWTLEPACDMLESITSPRLSFLPLSGNPARITPAGVIRSRDVGPGPSFSFISLLRARDRPAIYERAACRFLRIGWKALTLRCSTTRAEIVLDAVLQGSRALQQFLFFSYSSWYFASLGFLLAFGLSVDETEIRLWPIYWVTEIGLERVKKNVYMWCNSVFLELL